MKNTSRKLVKMMTLAVSVSMALPLAARSLDQQGSFNARGNANGAPSFSVFNRIDTNDDDLLSLDEVTLARLMRADKRFNRLDSDSDSLVTLEEYLAASDKRQDNFEEYGDELIACLEEALGEDLPERPDNLTPEERFNELDTTLDSVLDKDELAASIIDRVAETFARKDTDGDGFLSKEEFQEAAGDRIVRRKAMKQCIAELAEETEIFDELSGADTKAVAP